MSEVVVTMEFDRETLRTRRYTENTDEPLIGTLYVPKATLNKLGSPQAEKLTVTVALADRQGPTHLRPRGSGHMFGQRRAHEFDGINYEPGAKFRVVRTGLQLTGMI